MASHRRKLQLRRVRQVVQDWRRLAGTFHLGETLEQNEGVEAERDVLRHLQDRTTRQVRNKFSLKSSVKCQSQYVNVPCKKRNLAGF